MISFNKIEELFDPEIWDVGYLSRDNVLRCAYSPVKGFAHGFGRLVCNNTRFENVSNAVVVVRTGHHWDYTHYQEAAEILRGCESKKWEAIYTNFKFAAILGGVGVRARNSLIYSYKFGFDCHIAVFMFHDEIVDIPTNQRVNNKLWSRCNGCDDCVKACPVSAIHGTEEPYWLDSALCDDMIGLGVHERIPSIRSFWQKNVYPDYTDEQADKLVSELISSNRRVLPFDRNGYKFDGQVVRKDGVAVNVPFCRECTSQPRCSKWNGDYPYHDLEKQGQVIRFYKK